MYYFILGLYFFVVGFLFREMLDEVKTNPDSWWPITGALLVTLFWLPALIWWIVGLFSFRAASLWEKFAATIFEPPKAFEGYEAAMRKHYGKLKKE